MPRRRRQESKLRRLPIGARGAMKALRLTGLVVFPIILIFGIDLEETWRTLRGSHVGLVLTALLIMEGAILLRAWRWKLVAEASGVNYPRFWNYLVVYYTGLFAGISMPQVAASFAPVLFVSETGRSWRRTALSVGFDRLVELLVSLAFAVAAAVYLFPVFPQVSMAVIGVVAGLALAGSGGFLTLRWLRRRLERRPESRLRRLGDVAALLESKEASEVFKALRARLPAVAMLSVAVFLTQTAAVLCVAEALSLDVSRVFLAMSWSLVVLAVMLPISVVGLGPREGVLVLMFHAVGEPREAALALGVLMFVVGVLTRLPGALVWLPGAFSWLSRAPADGPQSEPNPTQQRDEPLASPDGG